MEDRDLLLKITNDIGKITNDIEWIKDNHSRLCIAQEKRIGLCEKRFNRVETDVDDLKASRDRQRGALTIVELAVGSGILFSILALAISMGWI